VNKLDKVYAALDQTRKTVCILQSIKATSKRSLVQQEQKKQLSKKCKRKQGEGASKISCAPFDESLTQLASSATESLRNWNWEASDELYPASHLEYEEEFCQHCHDHLALDVKISAQLGELHFLVKHAHNDAKFSLAKEE